MKTLIRSITIKILLIFFLFIIITSYSYSQIYPWSPLQKITSGYDDRNPSFGTKQQYFGMLFDWEFMVFERHQDSVSNICVLKMGTGGPVDSVIYITGNSTLNQNPSVSYSGNSLWFQTTIVSSLAVWESRRNGRWDIYASYYTSNTGWQDPFPVDTSALDKFHPQSVCIDSLNYAITYGRNNDIIFRIINGQTHNVSYDTNLTADESAICNNPYVTIDHNYYVSYQKKKADNDFEIDFRGSNTLPNWSQADTIAFEGNNFNNGFVAYFNKPVNIFVSDRLGNFNIYGNALDFFEGQKPIVIDTASENYDYESFLYPIITDGGFYNQANAYIRKTDSVKIIFGDYYMFQRDSVTVSDSNSNVSLTMNRGLHFGMFDALVWVVFNKDSLNHSGLYGKSLQIIISDIRQTSGIIPEKFELYQNYPNPFNPVTKIKFDIPQINENNASDVQLIIYDQLGREVLILLDKQLNSGTYEVTWDAGKYSSGIYYYKLTAAGRTGNFAITRKLLLLK